MAGFLSCAISDDGYFFLYHTVVQGVEQTTMQRFGVCVTVNPGIANVLIVQYWLELIGNHGKKRMIAKAIVWTIKLF